MTPRELVKKARARSKAKGLNFDLKQADVVIPKVCPILGTKIQRGGRHAPSIDRIVPKRGYVKENIRVVSVLANRMMSDASNNELVAFAEWVLREIKCQTINSTKTESLPKSKSTSITRTASTMRRRSTKRQT